MSVSDFDRRLPGDPSKRLVRDVRRTLAVDGIRPNSITLWRETWKWASAIRTSYVFPRWPSVSEIATQYLFLLLAERKARYGLRMPHRAAEKATPAVREILARAAAVVIALPAATVQPAEAPKALPAHELNLFEEK